MTKDAAGVGTALDYLSQVLAWAEVGQQQAPRGKTVVDLNAAGVAIRAALQGTNSVSVPSSVREALEACAKNRSLAGGLAAKAMRDLEGAE